ncbi:MAG TPA: hypothetical protein VEA18_00360 [Candidatus Kapabacteria bacterium]|nr:hypothetical protein [Candidatus Kapabacteria bacterium]
MNEERFEVVKDGILGYVRDLFEEMEEEMLMQHQEKLALLEDSFENATDMDELRVAFEQWYNAHAEDLQFEQEMEELWLQAMGEIE